MPISDAIIKKELYAKQQKALFNAGIILTFQYIGCQVVDAGLQCFKRFSVTLIVVFHKQVFHSGYILGSHNALEINNPCANRCNVVFDNIKKGASSLNMSFMWKSLKRPG